VSDHRFPREHRLLDACAYSRVFDAVDARASHRHLLILAARNDLPHHRLGVIVARKNIRLAVDRNRFKRITREFFRTRAFEPPGLDIIVMARRGADSLDNKSLSTILRHQWQMLTNQ
jgi:ribonuclease P protein component